MTFDFDPAKSAANLAKHGIDFEEAQAIWDDDAMIVAPARTEDEPRWLAVGRIGRRHWTAVYTLRDGTVRIISVRRSRRDEIDAYQGR
jgi:uncharacterized DUF497 family protein